MAHDTFAYSVSRANNNNNKKNPYIHTNGTQQSDTRSKHAVHRFGADRRVHENFHGKWVVCECCASHEFPLLKNSFEITQVNHNNSPAFCKSTDLVLICTLSRCFSLESLPFSIENAMYLVNSYSILDRIQMGNLIKIPRTGPDFLISRTWTGRWMRCIVVCIQKSMSVMSRDTGSRRIGSVQCTSERKIASTIWTGKKSNHGDSATS